MTRRMQALAVFAWVLVVVAGSALTWVAIGRAGRQVTGNPSEGQTKPAVVGAVGGAPQRTRSPHHGGSGPRATASSADKPPRTKAGSPTSAPVTGRPSSPGTSPSKSGASAPVQPQARTWSGSAGTVTVSCSGRTAHLEGTSPSDGWQVELGDSSGSEIEVKFERSETEVVVKATCVGGVPHFDVQTGGSDATGGSLTGDDR